MKLLEKLKKRHELKKQEAEERQKRVELKRQEEWRKFQRENEVANARRVVARKFEARMYGIDDREIELLEGLSAEDIIKMNRLTNGDLLKIPFIGDYVGQWKLEYMWKHPDELFFKEGE